MEDKAIDAKLVSNIKFARARQINQYNCPVSEDRFRRALDYVIEEVVEVRKECTSGDSRYKLFKQDKPINQQALLDELSDLYIVTINALALSGQDPEDIAEAVAKKLSYNESRLDHITNL